MTKKSLIIIITVVVVLAIGGTIAFINRQPEPILPMPPQEPDIQLPDRELTFKTLSMGYSSGYWDRKDYVIKEISEWKNLWDITHLKVSPKPDIPNINFNDKMVIAVFKGLRSTGGYRIEITEIIERENSVEVFVKEISPLPEDIVTMALTQPYHIVKIERVDKKVIFKR